MDHVLSGLARIVPVLQGKPRLASWSAAILKEIQLITDAAQAIMVERNIETDNPEMLRMLASFVNQPILSDDLETLRKLIKGRIIINNSDALRTDVNDILELWGVINDAILVKYDGGVEIYLTVGVGGASQYLKAQLEDVVAAGIQIRIIECPATGGFAFSPSAGAWSEGLAEVKL
jgi:hypothetical protein